MDVRERMEEAVRGFSGMRYDWFQVMQAINELVASSGPCKEGWRCEAHPEQGWPHDDCPGPGMPCGHCIDD